MLFMKSRTFVMSVMCISNDVCNSMTSTKLMTFMIFTYKAWYHTVFKQYCPCCTLLGLNKKSIMSTKSNLFFIPTISISSETGRIRLRVRYFDFTIQVSRIISVSPMGNAAFLLSVIQSHDLSDICNANLPFVQQSNLQCI